MEVTRTTAKYKNMPLKTSEVDGGWQSALNASYLCICIEIVHKILAYTF